jgi:phosphoenolpyruvate---glycerone phosphotransferase subunit DhaK
VGDIAGCHLDAHGCAPDASINRRLVGISLEKLRPSGGILAVLRGGYADVLVTDAVTASAVLDLQREPLYRRQGLAQIPKTA